MNHADHGSRADLGKQGEALALADYQKDGYQLVAANYRTRRGEVDVIVKKNGLLVFAEVKTRSGRPIAAPREWVNAEKQRKIRAATLAFLASRKLSDPPLRFDVVEVYFAADGSHSLNRIENAF